MEVCKYKNIKIVKMDVNIKTVKYTMLAGYKTINDEHGILNFRSLEPSTLPSGLTQYSHESLTLLHMQLKLNKYFRLHLLNFKLNKF